MASARWTWERAVASAQPRTSATSANDRSSKKRSTTAARCVGPNSAQRAPDGVGLGHGVRRIAGGGEVVELGHRQGRGAASDHPQARVDDRATHVGVHVVGRGELVAAAVEAEQGVLDGVAGVLGVAGDEIGEAL